jgi:vanillate O-demethylase ferredoxin subunit
MTIDVTIIKKESIADDIVLLVLADPQGGLLPPFEPGAHIDLHIDRDTVRQYSLINSLDRGRTYEVAILREADGRGGSARVHDQLQAGDHVRISAPRNAFPLQRADFSILIAGGIGITPILSMARHLQHEGQPFALHYCARSRPSAAFCDSIEHSAFADKARFYFDADGQRFDTDVLRQPDIPDTRIFVCGPPGFIDFITRTALDAGWPADRIHYELFQKAAADQTGHGEAFTLVINSSGDRVPVAADETALEALERSGYEVACSCEQGICGTCVLTVLDGIPDHQDSYLTDRERAENRSFTPCCSRALTPTLTIDL